jgi:hypothetical protein
VSPFDEALTVVIATVGRPTLQRAVSSARALLPGAGIVFAPSSRVDAGTLELLPGDAILPPTDSLYGAWNESVRHARPGRIMFLNDDDYLRGQPLDREWLPTDADTLVNIPFRREGARPRLSLSRFIPTRSMQIVDLLHSNGRGNINSFLWPVSMFEKFGHFDESLAIRADVEWMSRSVHRWRRVVQARRPTYVQTRGPDRLSSASTNGDRLTEEARVLAATLHHRHRPGKAMSSALDLWVRNVERSTRRAHR